MKQRNILILILFQISFYTMFAQQSEGKYSQLKDIETSNGQSIIANTDSSITKFNSQITLGACELMGISAGYSFNSKNILMLRLSLGVLLKPATGSDAIATAGNTIGIKYIHIFNEKGFVNAINLGIAAFYSISASYTSYPIDTFVKGYMIEATVGKKAPVSGQSKFEFIYEAGGIITRIKGHELRFLPSIKLGMNYNF